MKKTIGLVLAVMLSGVLFAQMPNFGIKAAATAASINTTDLNANYASDNLLGYQIGVFARINSGKLYIQPEVVYNHRNTQILNYPGGNLEFKVGSIDIPVLVGAKLIDGKVFNLRAFLGPEASFATSKEYGDRFEISASDFNDLTWYVQGGVGVDLLFMTFDIRYEKGLDNFYEGGELNLKNNVWVFSLGLKFM